MGSDLTIQVIPDLPRGVLDRAMEDVKALWPDPPEGTELDLGERARLAEMRTRTLLSRLDPENFLSERFQTRALGKCLEESGLMPPPKETVVRVLEYLQGQGEGVRVLPWDLEAALDMEKRALHTLPSSVWCRLLGVKWDIGGYFYEPPPVR